nr:hypothetical protein L203_01743 [Cryptococcus depauperatus CBS 7841]
MNAASNHITVRFVAFVLASTIPSLLLPLLSFLRLHHPGRGNKLGGYIDSTALVFETYASCLSISDISLATAESQEEVLVYGEDGKITGYKHNNTDKHKMCVVFDNLDRGLDVEMSADFKASTRLSGSRAAKSNPIKYKQQRISPQGSTSDKYGLRFAGTGIACKWPATHSLVDNINVIFPSVFDQLPPGSEHFHSKTMSSTYSDVFEYLYKIEKDTLDSVLEIRKQAEELATAVDTTEWDFAGSLILFFVGRVKSGKKKTQVGFIDFTHAEPHESELGPEGIQEGFKPLNRL